MEAEEEKSKGVSIVDLQSSYFCLCGYFWFWKKMWNNFCFFQVGLIVEEVEEVATKVDGEEGLEGGKARVREDIF